MPIEPDQPGGSHDPTRANDPVDPTVAQDPVDATTVQGAAPAAGMGRSQGHSEPFGEEPLRRRPDQDPRKGAWWPWALLGAILIGIVLFALLGGDDDDDDAVGTTDQTETTDNAVGGAAPPETAAEDTTVVTTAPPEPDDDDGSDTDPTTTTSAAPADPADGAGTVTTTDGTDLFGLVQGDDGDADRLAPVTGTDVTGRDVQVLEVVDGAGFWIGPDGEQQQLFVHTTDDVAVEEGDSISFDGSVEANPDDAFGMSEDEGAELLRQQGHHIELGSLTPG